MKKLIVTIIILIVAAFSFLAGGWYGKDHNGSPEAPAERKVLYYVDPMNPGFRSDEPGIAPCGMPLEPVYADAGEEQTSAGASSMSMSPGAVKVSLSRQQLIGVNVSPVEVKPMTYTLRLYGRIVPDETRIYRINASTDSWVRELSDITTGSIVGSDQLLAEVLAPAFYNAQVTYLVAMDNLDRIRAQLGVEIRHQQTHLADNQIRMAVQALQNLGITDAQIEELANTREAQPYLQVRSPVDGVVLNRNLTLYEWFEAGEQFFSIADISRVWVYADVYEDEVMHLRPGMDVKVRHEQMDKIFDARIGQVLPLFDPIAKTLKVRIDVDSPRYDLRPDMFVDVEIPITMPPSLHLPADAVLDSGTKKIIYVETGNGIFEPRRVETGWRLGRRVEITGGLMPGERVLVSGNFLIDSESRMKTAASGIQPVMHKDPVCGMDVDPDNTPPGKTSLYGGEPFYFCSDWCKETFEKDPETYIQRMKNRETHKGHPSVIAKNRSWMDLLEPVRSSHVMKKSGTFPGQEMKRTIGTSATSPGVVDWDGPDPEGAAPRDWGGWGKFPGAQYLGLKQKTQRRPKQNDTVLEPKSGMKHENNNGSSLSAPAPASHAHHPEMNDEMQEAPASNGPAQSAD